MTTTATPTITVRCPCSRLIKVRRPAGPAAVTCPACRTKLRIGGATASRPAQNAAVKLKSSVKHDNLFDGLDAMLALQPPTQPQRFRPAPSNGHPHRPARPAAQRPARHVAQRPARPGAKTSPAKRLPRLPIFGDGYGIVISLVAGVVMLVVSAGIGVSMIQGVMKSTASAENAKSWLAADGRILDAGVDIKGLGRKQRGTPHIQYAYSVVAADYTGSTLSFSDSQSVTPSIAEVMLRPYPVGSTTKVYYDPQNPATSVLNRDVQKGNFISVWGGAALILLGIVMMIDGIFGAINDYRFPPKKLPLW